MVGGGGHDLKCAIQTMVDGEHLLAAQEALVAKLDYDRCNTQMARELLDTMRASSALHDRHVALLHSELPQLENEAMRNGG